MLHAGAMDGLSLVLPVSSVKLKKSLNTKTVEASLPLPLPSKHAPTYKHRERLQGLKSVFRSVSIQSSLVLVVLGSVILSVFKVVSHVKDNYGRKRFCEWL